MRTATRSFAGANIKGTPSMPAASVRNDVRKISKFVDVFVVQEFKWRWYWATIRSVLSAGWRSSPGFAAGILRPINGGQAAFWKRKSYRKIATKVIEAFDFGLDNAGIMDNRWIRAVLLEDKLVSLQCWFATTHFVVGGDERSDGARRRLFMSQNLNALDSMLGYMSRSDAPIIFQGDLNIHRGSWAYADLLRLVGKYHGRIIGTHGVEFLIIFDFHCDTKVVVTKEWVMEPKKVGLKTDHEVRCIDYYLKN